MNKELFDYIKYDTPDDGAGGGDLVLEGVFETEGLEEEETFYLEGDPNIPVIEEKPEEDSPEIKALKEQNDLLTQQMTTLQTQADSTAALTKGLENLGQNMRQPVQQVPVSVDPKVEKEEYNAHFYDDPKGNLEEFAKAKIEPALQQMMSANSKFSREFLLLDKDRGEIYKKYGPEVDEVFNQLSPQKRFQDPNAYKEAADIVASKHLPETMSDMKETLRKEIIAELKETKSGSNQQEPVLHGEIGGSGRPAQRGKSFVLPKDVWDYAGRMGYQRRGEAEDKQRIYQWWKDGQLKACGVEYK